MIALEPAPPVLEVESLAVEVGSLAALVDAGDDGQGDGHGTSSSSGMFVSSLASSPGVLAAVRARKRNRRSTLSGPDSAVK